MMLRRYVAKRRKEGKTRITENIESDGTLDTKEHFVNSQESEREENSEKCGNLRSTDAEDDVTQLRKELSDLPIAELLQLKEKVGEKLYDEVLYGSQGNRSSPSRKLKKYKRENKNRPMEMSSKRPVSRLREVVSVKKSVTRDPRFDDLSGEYNETYFKQAYGFLTDVKQREKQKLLRALKKEKNEEKHKKLQRLLTRMTQQEKVEREKDQRLQKERERKKKERALVAEGKKPYFMKKSEKRKLELAEKFKRLEQTGKVEKYLAKRKKKITQKERKKLPHDFN